MSTPVTSTARTKVLLVDDHDLIRRGLRHAFERDRQFEVVGEASTAAEAVRQAGALQPDVVIMDLRLPDGSGLEATRALRKTSAARAQVGSRSNAAAFRRMQDKVVLSEAVGAAAADLVNDSVDDRLAALEEQEQVERLLAEIKARRRAE